MNYISSIVNNYGDKENMPEDACKLVEILGRQGSYLFLEILADDIGMASLKHDLTSEESIKALKSLIEELKELTLERI